MMKDPTDKHYPFECDELDEDADCFGCGEPWPCPKVQRWHASDSYRILKATEDIEQLKQANARQGKEISELRSKVRVLETYQQGTWPLLNDAAGFIGSQLAVNIETDYQDFTLWGSAAPMRIAARRELKVEYMDKDGSRYENGRCIEKVYPGP